MKRALTGLAVAGLAASLMACVYYPHGPYGPGYGPPPPAGYNAPPQGGEEYGPPPGQQPPPGYGQENGPPPQAYGPPPQQGGNGPSQQGAYAASRPLTPGQIQKMNDPNWCAQHPHRCEKLKAEYAAEQGGPPPQGYGPPPSANEGPPPDEE